MGLTSADDIQVSHAKTWHCFPTNGGMTIMAMMENSCEKIVKNDDHPDKKYGKMKNNLLQLLIMAHRKFCV
jgi:hypothetical protein